MPCGRCRQLLWEHGGPDCLVDHVDGPEPMAALLPDAFDDTDLGRAPREPKPSTAVPASLALLAGTGTVFVHPDVVGGSQVWTAYWERSSKFGADPDEPTGILEEGPSWPSVRRRGRLGTGPHARGWSSSTPPGTPPGPAAADARPASRRTGPMSPLPGDQEGT